jgi:two-component system, cell cycle sensor histidine kinase and response regulator CckA
LSHAKIMIIEDESVVALDLQARLNRLGHQIVGIGNSQDDALRLAASWHPDLAFMDIHLRGVTDGVEIAQQLRSSYNIPVIYLTAYADDITLQRAKITEPVGYLIKPFEERELHSTIEMALYKIQVERKLQEQAARLQQIVSTVPEGVALLDDNRCVVFANTQAEDFLSLLADAKIGDIIERLGELPVEELLNTEDWHDIILGTSKQRVFEAIAKPANPIKSIDSFNDQASDWVLVIREVTAEREMRHRAQAQDRLAAVGQLAAGIAHDFNNILLSITLGTDVIQMMEPNLSPKAQDRLEIISQQARRASDLIRQILDFSRTSAMEMKPFDLVPLLKELTEMLERMLPESVRLELVSPTTSHMINGDTTRIMQLLVNLSLNARDAMPNGGELRIEAQLSGDQQWVQIKVIDSGEGIHADVLPHIFEPFFTTKSPGKGTGLGLAQVQGIIQQHNGYIRVESELDRGTTISIYLPALPSQPQSQVESGNHDNEPTQGNQQTILIVEDNIPVQQSMFEILSLLNYQVFTAANGHEALSILEQPDVNVDLIVSDLVMPEMGGLELCRKLRQNQNDVSIIIMTGYLSDEVLKELKSLMIIECLNKPLELDDLSRAVQGALLKQYT